MTLSLIITEMININYVSIGRVHIYRINSHD